MKKLLGFLVSVLLTALTSTAFAEDKQADNALNFSASVRAADGYVVGSGYRKITGATTEVTLRGEKDGTYATFFGAGRLGEYLQETDYTLGHVFTWGRFSLDTSLNWYQIHRENFGMLVPIVVPRYALTDSTYLYGGLEYYHMPKYRDDNGAMAYAGAGTTFTISNHLKLEIDGRGGKDWVAHANRTYVQGSVALTYALGTKTMLRIPELRFWKPQGGPTESVVSVSLVQQF